MADEHYIQNVPVPYMDLQTIWSDRRDPHSNPLSTGSQGRRMTARSKPDAGLAKTVDAIYRPGVGDEGANYPLANKRLYEGQKK